MLGKRRLLIRPGAIGDTILWLPAAECLRAAYTEIWVASCNIPLIRNTDRVDSILSTGLDTFGLPDHAPRVGLIERLRGFDSIVSWYGANRPEFRAAMEQWKLPVRFFPALPPDGGKVHAADFYLAQARNLSNRKVDPIPHLDCPRRDAGFAVIHPFSGSLKKNWPLERYRELARLLGEHLPVRWCAGPEESLADAVRFDNLYDLAGWLATARVYIGNDSGITHLAAAVGAPVVALFGPSNARVWAPRGARVTVLEAMAQRDVETVLAAALVSK